MPDTEIQESLVSRKVIVSVEDGQNANGSAIIKNRSFNNINADASVEAMHATAKALVSLMDKNLANVFYDDKSLLQEVENA